MTNIESGNGEVCLDLDLDLLLHLGQRLDDKLESERWETVREFLAVSLLKIRDKDGMLRPLEMNEAQRIFERQSGLRNVVLKARQLGMTTWVAARFFLNTITRPGTLTVQVAHDQESAEQIFRIVHRFVENLPVSLRRGVLQPSRANVRQIVFPRLDSEYRVETAADPNAGRGLTIQNLHCSEVARWPGEAAETLAGLRAAVPTTGEIVLESTPKGAYGCFYREWRDSAKHGYVRHFFPWWIEKSYRLPANGVDELTPDESALIARDGLDREQIAFRRQMKLGFGQRALEEFGEDAETCFVASGTCVFDEATLSARLKALPEPVEVRDAGRLEVYWPSVRGRNYVVAVDAAGGGCEGDNACIEVLDRSAGMQCAEWYGPGSPAETAEFAARLAREYNDAILVVERNNHGMAVLAYLDAVQGYRNVYYATDRQAGWLTTASTRPSMLMSLISKVDREIELLSSARLLRELRTFVRTESGRMEAASGEHDDAVMATALGLAVI